MTKTGFTWAIVLSLLAFLAAPLLVTVSPDTKVSPDPSVGQSRVLIAVVASLFLVLAFLLIGKAMKERWLGMLIDRRNRYSLSRLQITLWTLLILSALYVALVTNTLHQWGDPPASLTVLKVDWQVLALMGISVASFVSSPMALSVKGAQTPSARETNASISQSSQREGNEAAVYDTEGKLLTRADPKKAQLADFLRGEEVGNAATLDIARIQMLAITFIVWVYYAVQVLSTFSGSAAVIDSLPSLNENVVLLVLISHGGYIGGKLVPNSTSTRDKTAQNLAALSAVSMRAAQLKSEIDTFLKDGATAPWIVAVSKQYAADAAKIGADAQGLTARVGNGDAVDEEVARLKGRLDALDSAFRMSKAQVPVPPADVPSPQLVGSVKKGLREAGYTIANDAAEWDGDAEKALQAFVKDQGIIEDALPKALVPRLEKIRSMVS